MSGKSSWATVTVGIAALASASACYEGRGGADGADDGGEGSGSASDGGSGSGDDGEPAACDGSASPLRRLSEAQYRNTLHDLFAPHGLVVEDAIASDLARIPADDAGTTFGILDARVSEMHVRAYYLIADGLSYAIVGDPATVASVVGPCAVGAVPDAACVDGFVDGFARRAYRRPLDDEERARLHAIAQQAPDAAEAVRSLLFSVLMSPQLLYHVEVEGEGDDLAFELGPYALASRLSYHFWQSMPDDALMAAAADGSILTDEGYAAQLDRVIDDPRTQATLDRFYDEWLHLGWITQLPTTAAFQTLAEGTTIGEPGADHLEAAQREIHDLARYYTWQTDGSLTDLLLSDLNVTTSPHLAALYGVEPWDGQSTPPSLPPERAGLVTRAGLLLTGDHQTHPIHRGATVRRRLLCEELPSPDPSALPDGALDPPVPTADQTTRQLYEAKTADSTCESCHALINPVGFALEGYDALGRARSEERVIDEPSGDVVATLPLDTAVELALGGEAVTVASGPELAAQVAASGRAEACFATQYFRATFGRLETAADACAVDRVTDVLLDGGSLKQALRAIAEDPMFRARRVDP